MSYELTNQMIQRKNRNKRYVETEEKLLEVAGKAGYFDIERKMGSAGNYIWTGSFMSFCGSVETDAMFAVERH